MPKAGYVYILANHQRRLYTGVTSQLEQRIRQHQRRVHPASFTARYAIDRLVYYECFDSINEAIARESTIKNMHRTQKIQLIVSLNPHWNDLSASWGQPTEPFTEDSIRPPETF